MVVAVKDGGVGLDAVDMQRMFTLSYTTKAAGTGVGLSISRSIIQAHGGRIWASQNADRGATFSFSVPVYISRHRDIDTLTENQAWLRSRSHTA